MSLSFKRYYKSSLVGGFREYDTRPQLTTPKISISNNYLTITNYSSFPSGTQFSVYRSYTSIGTFTGSGKNLTTYNLSEGTYTIKVYANATGYRESSSSNSLTYNVIKLATPVLSVTDGRVMKVANVDDYPGSANVQFCFVFETSGGEQYVKEGSSTEFNWCTFLLDKNAPTEDYEVTCQASADGYVTSDWSAVWSLTYNSSSLTISVGETFHHDYFDNSPDVYVTPSGIVSYYDDGGSIEFEGIKAGTCTITVSEGYLGEGQYEEVTIYYVTVNAATSGGYISSPGVISNAVIGETYWLSDVYPDDTFEAEGCYGAHSSNSRVALVMNHDDSGGDVKFKVTGAGTCTIYAWIYTDDEGSADGYDDENDVFYEYRGHSITITLA